MTLYQKREMCRTIIHLYQCEWGVSLNAHEKIFEFIEAFIPEMKEGFVQLISHVRTSTDTFCYVDREVSVFDFFKES